MKNFLLKSGLFLVLVFLSISWVFSRADGFFDPFYVRFTTPKQSSLILGSSIAAQGLQPKIINNVLNRDDLFNYAFTVRRSPYSKSYLESIKGKLDDKTTTGVFIVTVDAWSISKDTLVSEDYVDNFLNNVSNVNLKNNWEYLIKNYNYPYVKILFNNSVSFLHDDGWLEINIEKTEQQFNESLNKQLDDYIEKKSMYKFSPYRLSFLIEIISYLKKKGKVYLVRLPVHPKMMTIESDFMPNFDSSIEALSNDLNVPYLNLTSRNEDYKYLDGNHLYKNSGIEVSTLVAEWINSFE